MIKKNLADRILDASVNRHILQFMKEFGFQETNTHCWTFENNGCNYRVSVGMLRYCKFIDICFSDIALTEKNDYPKGVIPLHNVSLTAFPEMREIKRYPREIIIPELQLKFEVKRLAMLLKRTLDWLMSDSANWDMVLSDYAADWSNNKSEDETTKDYIRRLQIEADLSWTRFEFWKTKKRLEKIKSLPNTIGAIRSLRLFISQKIIGDYDYWL